MGSKGLGADVNLAWPTAQIAVMGASGAVRFLHRAEIRTATEAALATDPAADRFGTPESVKELIAELEKGYEQHMLTPYRAAERGLIDEVILPSETRTRVIKNLRLLTSKKVPWPARKHGNIPL